MQHRSMRVGRVVALALATVVGGVALRAAPDAGTSTGSYQAVTKPSQERSLAFSYPGVVREVAVKEGDKVKADQTLMKLDDRIDRATLAYLEIDANSPLKVEYARKSRDEKQVKFQRLQELYKNQAASELEMKEAELNAELAITQLALSEEETQTAKYKAEGQRIKVELAQLKSPFDGIVHVINVKEGEYADPQQSQHAACMVVKNDPLKVEVFLPSPVARKLSYGQELEVLYPDETKPMKAKITLLAPVADAGSGLRKVWLEMPNPENRESGTQVQVQVPESK